MHFYAYGPWHTGIVSINLGVLKKRPTIEAKASQWGSAPVLDKAMFELRTRVYMIYFSYYTDMCNIMYREYFELY